MGSPLILVDAARAREDVEALIVVIKPLGDVEPLVERKRAEESGRAEASFFQHLCQH